MFRRYWFFPACPRGSDHSPRPRPKEAPAHRAGPRRLHPPGTHEYDAGIRILARVLGDVPDLTSPSPADAPGRTGPN